MSIINKLIGKGMKFPFVPTVNHGVSSSESIERINQSLTILFNTSKNSRLMMPDFGSDIRKYRFDPYDKILLERLRQSILTDVKQWEPRISINSIEFYDDEETQNNRILYISIYYTIINTEVKGNLVYPYQREVYDMFSERSK